MIKELDILRVTCPICNYDKLIPNCYCKCGVWCAYDRVKGDFL